MRPFAWQRIDGGYELHDGDVVYRVQRRKDLSDRQKWDLDQRLGLRPRDGKRREPWVVLIGTRPFEHWYGKKDATESVETSVSRRRLERVEEPARRPRLSLGCALELTPLRVAPPASWQPEVEGLGREDMRVFVEHLPELRGAWR